MIDRKGKRQRALTQGFGLAFNYLGFILQTTDF